MAKELLHTAPASVVAITDESYGGGERDGKAVEFVERYGLWVSQAFDQEPIGPLMVTGPADLEIVRGSVRRVSKEQPPTIQLGLFDRVLVNVAVRSETDRYGRPFLKYGAPRGEYPVFAGPPLVTMETGEVREDVAGTAKGRVGASSSNGNSAH